MDKNLNSSRGENKTIEVSKAIIERDNKFLLFLRSASSKTYPNTWDFAGGKLDPGETPSEAIVREIKEETNFDIEPGPEIKTYTYKDADYTLVFHLFWPKIISGELNVSEEHSAHKWFDKKELSNSTLHPVVKMWFN